MSKRSSRRQRQEFKKRQEVALTGPALAQQGRQAFQQGRYYEAIQAWEKARAKSDAPPRLAEALAEAYFRRAVTQSGSALADLSQAVKLQPADRVYRYHLALAHQRQRQFEQAEPIYRQLLAESPPYTRAAIPLAQLLIDQKKALSKDPALAFLEPAAHAQLLAAEAVVRGKATSTLQRLVAEAPVDSFWCGMAALALGDKSTAQRSLAEALADSPPLNPIPGAVARYYLGLLLAQAGDIEAALAHWQTACTQGFQPQPFQYNLSALSYRQALAHYQAGQWAEAFKLLEPIPWPGMAADLARQLRLELAYTAAQRGQWDEALRHWSVSEQSGNDSRALLFNLALAYQKTDQPFEAAERWRELLRRRPRKANDPDALSDEQVARIWQNVAENYNLAGLYDEAITTYKNALKWSPQNLELRLKLVEAQQAAGRWGAAENELNRILAQHPKHVPALVMLAEMYAEDYFPERARRLWQQVLDLEPQHPVARQQMAYLFEREAQMAAQWGNHRRALDILQQGLAQFPDSQRLYTAKGAVYAMQRQFDQARQAFDQAVALNPNDLPTFHTIFTIWLAHKAKKADLNRTIEQIKAVTTPIPASFFIDLVQHCLDSKQNALAESLLDYCETRYAEEESALLELAMMRGDLGQFEHAADLLRRILKTNPDHPRANLNLGAVYQQMGQTRLAQRHWDKAEQLARQANDHQLLYELKLIKDMMLRGKKPPQSLMEIWRDLPPELRQQFINQLPPDMAAMLNRMGPNALDMILGSIPDDLFDFDEDDEDDYF